MRWLTLAIVTVPAGWWALETFRPASVAYWQAEITAARKAQFDFMSAERHYRHAIAEARHFGPQDARLADSLMELAMRSQGAADDLQAIPPRRNPLLAIHDNVKSSYLRSLIREKRINALYMEGIRIAGQAYAGQPLVLADKYDAVGRYFLSRKDFQRTGDYYQRAFALREKALGAHSPQLIDYLEAMGHFSAGCKQYAQAETYFRRMLSIEEKVYGPYSQQVQNGLSSMGREYCDQQQYRKALPCYLRAFAIDERRFGRDNIRLYWSGYDVVNVYQQMGDFAHAGQLRARLEGIRRRHPEFELM